MLHARGIDASILDSIPLLIGMVALSQLPAGPSVGAAAALLILGTDGVATAAGPFYRHRDARSTLLHGPGAGRLKKRGF